MNRKVLINALTAMGYRNMDKNLTDGNNFGKPVGFGIIICHIDNDKTMRMSTMFQSYDTDELRCWSSEDIDIEVPIDKKTGLTANVPDDKLFDVYCNRIAYGEYCDHANKIIEQGSRKKTLSFITKLDMINNFNF